VYLIKLHIRVSFQTMEVSVPLDEEELTVPGEEARPVRPPVKSAQLLVDQLDTRGRTAAGR